MEAMENEGRRQAQLLGAIPMAVSEWHPLEVSPARPMGQGTGRYHNPAVAVAPSSQVGHRRGPEEERGC